MDVTIRPSRVDARRRHAVENPGGSATLAEQEKCKYCGGTAPKNGGGTSPVCTCGAVPARFVRYVGWT
jgi:hypothetical protein